MAWSGQSEDCDFSPMKEMIKTNLTELAAELQESIGRIDSEGQCLLERFEQFGRRFQRVQSVAGSFYLNCYLSPFTERYNELTLSLRHLSKRKIGALIVVQRDDLLADFLHNGIPVGASVSHLLLESLFHPGSPLHDGAVLVQGNAIVSAANVLPLSAIHVHQKMGTRHRAAVGLSERSDAIVLVVSEETGATSFAANGHLYPVLLH
ncbi:sporulation-specific diadenylate cyclase CdaS [Cohnella sp. REN36]|uniref:sporulation-specific diadenylate cyclase CdaS n=1 Tax=Cohnella sp. REN36 TaxID=2887347 RepID=UPI001D13C019|nr:sporulation-specific diadenylate cyclase CdaS [Cohnella sp. REN36]MCC3374384.1 sporulation-specific diadenylate cyclase CdaS [Cohnella sp. REN36]